MMDRQIGVYIVDEVKDILKLRTKKTVLKSIHSGKLKSCKIGKSFYIKEEWIHEFLNNEMLNQKGVIVNK